MDGLAQTIHMPLAQIVFYWQRGSFSSLGCLVEVMLPHDNLWFDICQYLRLFVKPVDLRWLAGDRAFTVLLSMSDYSCWLEVKVFKRFANTSRV